MSIFKFKTTKIHYKSLEPEKNDDSVIVLKGGFSLDEANLFINNFVNAGDTASSSKILNFRDASKKPSWDILYKNSKLTQNLSDSDASRYATFLRIKRKLENMKNFYPDLYHSDRSVIEMWAKNNELGQINQDVLDYDGDSPGWLWI